MSVSGKRGMGSSSRVGVVLAELGRSFFACLGGAGGRARHLFYYSFSFHLRCEGEGRSMGKKGYALLCGRKTKKVPCPLVPCPLSWYGWGRTCARTKRQATKGRGGKTLVGECMHMAATPAAIGEERLDFGTDVRPWPRALGCSSTSNAMHGCIQCMHSPPTHSFHPRPFNTQEGGKRSGWKSPLPCPCARPHPNSSPPLHPQPSSHSTHPPTPPTPIQHESPSSQARCRGPQAPLCRRAVATPLGLQADGT